MDTIVLTLMYVAGIYLIFKIGQFSERHKVLGISQRLIDWVEEETEELKGFNNKEIFDKLPPEEKWANLGKAQKLDGYLLALKEMLDNLA